MALTLRILGFKFHIFFIHVLFVLFLLAEGHFSASAQTISTIAGTGAAGSLGDGGPATAAQLTFPGGVTLDAIGNVYIADYFNDRVRKITTSTGIITTIAGTGVAGYSGDGGLATAAKLYGPSSVAFDAAGNIYIADKTNSRIRKITVSTGIINTIAGTGTSGNSGDGGPATAAQLNISTGVALDVSDNIYIADFANHSIRKIDVGTGIINTIAGTGFAGFSGDGGPAAAAQLRSPFGLAVDAAGDIYIADDGNHRIRKITIATGIINTVAGTGTGGYNGDGIVATSAQLKNPTTVALDAAGNMYISDETNYRIRKIDIGTGIISTIAGTGVAGFSGDGGPATAARLNLPYGVAVQGCEVYIADENNNRIRKISCASAPLAITASSTNLSCNNQCIGTGTASASGGTTPYTYSWTGGQTSSTATGLCSGFYTVTVTDAASAITTATINITEPPVLAVSISPTSNVTCNSLCNGSASASASGGTPGYAYSWSTIPVQISPTAASLCAGAYTVSIIDNNGCTATQAVTITEPAAITTSTSITQASCGNNIGTASVNVSGGTPGYSYLWNSTPVQTTLTATGLGVGSYTCTITDANGCTQTAVANVTNSGAPSVTLSSQTNVLCKGGSSGSAVMTASGGTLPYTYSWNTVPSQSTSAATGLSASNYILTVTDGAGCIQIQGVTITEPAAITASTSITQASCGNSIGTATANASGGTGSYTYLWNAAGQATQTATGLGIGTYTCIITDANGCTQTAIANVSSSGVPFVSLSGQTNVTCNGGSNGSASVTVTGGTPGYAYSWSPSGGATTTATNLSAGNYVMTVTDGAGCSNIQPVTITEPPAITVTTSSTPSFCSNNNGSAMVTASGGTGVLAYIWNPSGQITVTATGLSGGNYMVTVVDASGCMQTAIAVVSQTGTAPTASTSFTQQICAQLGTATVTVSAGTSPYTYQWCNGQTTSTATGLSAGTCTVIVTDSTGCSTSGTVTITSGTNTLVVAASATAAGCDSMNNTGTATATMSTGTSPYTYLWSNAQTTSTSTGLSIGTYTVTVSDSNGCTQITTTSVTQSAGPTADAGADATIVWGKNTTLTAGGGGTYVWSNGGGSTSSIIVSPTKTTQYCVTVTDTNNCTDMACVTVYVEENCSNLGELYLPNVFSPNADGENDSLQVYYGNFLCIEKLHIVIFNLWGEKIYESKDPNFKWDGIYSKGILKEDGQPGTEVYVYYMDATLRGGKQISKKGNVSILR